MLAPIDLNYEALFQTDEVRYIGPYRMLPPELEVLQCSIAQQPPYSLFRIGE
jgi:hypothetical protein